MPLYEYCCEGCGHWVEVLQKHDDPAPVCDTCTEDMTKQVSRCSFALKGSGWDRDSYGLKEGG